MIDSNIIKKIVAAADIGKGEKILEIGPGLGVLTEQLAAESGHVAAVELDDKVISYIKSAFADDLAGGRLELIEGDALKINYPALGFEDFGFKIVANLPYSITAKFFRQFLETGPKPTEIIVMIQKEVAQRLVARAGDMSLLALSAQLYADPEILFAVPASCFWPAPEVDSAVVRLKLKREKSGYDAKKLFRLARIGFAAKRKQLHNNLAGGLGVSNSQIKKAFAELGFREDIRAQDLSVDDWIKLSEMI